MNYKNVTVYGVVFFMFYSVKMHCHF